MDERAEDALNAKSYAEAVHDLLDQGSETTDAFLRQQWLVGVTSTLRRLRREAGLTQEEVAARLGTTQSAVARLERDTEGRFSLHRLVDYLVACGVQPFDIQAVPTEDMLGFVRHNPESARTFHEFLNWAERGSSTPWHLDEQSESRRWTPFSAAPPRGDRVWGDAGDGFSAFGGREHNDVRRFGKHPKGATSPSWFRKCDRTLVRTLRTAEAAPQGLRGEGREDRSA